MKMVVYGIDLSLLTDEGEIVDIWSTNLPEISKKNILQKTLEIHSKAVQVFSSYDTYDLLAACFLLVTKFYHNKTISISSLAVTIESAPSLIRYLEMKLLTSQTFSLDLV